MVTHLPDICLKTANMGAYLRKMAIDDIIVNTDTTYLEKQFFEIGTGILAGR